MATDEQTPRSDADGGWKDIIGEFTEEFFEFYFPDVHAAIDFSVEVEFLDSELRQIVTDAKVTKRYADRLMKVRLRDGSDQWLYVHVEVQGHTRETEEQFAERMFSYSYRVFDRFRQNVISLAILADRRSDFRPCEYRVGGLGCGIHFTFHTAKLIDYTLAELEASSKTFALVTRVQLAYLEARRDAQKRFDRKVALTDVLLHSGYDEEKILRVFRFLDFVMRLPRPLAIQYRQELEAMEGELQMPYVTSIEKLAREEGALSRAREDVIEALEVRFGDVPYHVREAVNHVSTEAALKKLHRLAITVKNLDEFNV